MLILSPVGNEQDIQAMLELYSDLILSTEPNPTKKLPIYLL